MALSPRPAPLPFCVRKSTGEPMAGADTAGIARHLTAETVAPVRRAAGSKVLALAPGIDAADLGQAGWGVLFAASVPADIRAALRPLLEHRAEQAGALYRCFDGVRCCGPDESARRWVAENGGDFFAPDPAEGVPFYLLLVADPEEVSFEFQYDLDLSYAVGRVWFDTVEAFARYAASVVAQEEEAVPRRPRRIGVVATRHTGDAATQMFHDLVAKPLLDGAGAIPAIGEREAFERVALLAGDATRRQVLDLLTDGDGAPAILFTGSHGLGLDRGDRSLVAEQGAMVCADWTGSGTGPITADQIIAGRDLPDAAQVTGMIHFMFACYGGGCPQYDNFAHMAEAPAQIAEKPFVAALPNALLAHSAGSALAVIAHVERAWTYSFFDEFGQPRPNLFRHVLAGLARGERVGKAVDGANGYWAVHSTRLAELQHQALHDPDIDEDTLAAVWVARDDARNIVVLGDPAVRLQL